MIHECQISYLSVDEKGCERTVKENYVVENLGCFTEVEEKLLDEFGGLKALDVTKIKRSNIKEIANSRQDDSDKLWVAELEDIFTMDDGTEKELKYKILFFSKTIDSAIKFIGEYSKQGYQMTLVTLKKTNFKDVVE